MTTTLELQRRLKALGFDPGGLDGAIGPATLRAINAALDGLPAAPAAPVAVSATTDPSWIVTARKYLGQREVKGPHHNPHVLKWWKKMGAPFVDDETPWCGAFVGGVLSETGIKPVAGGAMAQAWLKLPVKLTKPAYGCVIVFWRGSPTSGQGHVGFVVGQDQAGNLMVLGGNQGDRVSIKPFARTGPNARIKGYRWPGVYPYPDRFNLPVMKSDGTLSTNEA